MIDSDFEVINCTGKFQRIVAFSVIIVSSLTLFLGISFPFLTKKPEMEFRHKNSFESTFNICHTEDLCKYDIYEYRKVSDGNLYNLSYEFDLYCERSFYIPLIGTSFFFGGMCGSLFISPIPDRYGRKGIFKLIVIFTFIIFLNLLFVVNAFHFVLINFFAGMSTFGYSMSTIIITEYLDRKSAGLVMSLNNALFPMTGIVVTLFFLLVNNWRILVFIVCILNFIIVLLTRKYFLESPRWLISQRKMMELAETLTKIAKINGYEENFKGTLTKIKSHSKMFN